MDTLSRQETENSVNIKNAVKTPEGGISVHL